MNDLLKYRSAIKAIKDAILISQYESVKSINEKQLHLDLSIGKYISDNTRNGNWGSDAIGIISEQLKKELPGLRGFSEKNLKNMRSFYEEWFRFLVFEQKSLLNSNSVDMSTEITIKDCNFKNDDFSLQNFFSISFSNHVLIIRMVKTLEERIYYVNRSATNHLTYRQLEELIESDDFHHRGKLTNNFITTIKDGRTASKAIDAFADQVLLPAVIIEELNCRDISDADERVLENAIVHNIKNFILTFGEGFEFIRNQFRVSAFDEERFVDLLFFNRDLNCLVDVELKRGSFKDGYLGQLNNYLMLLDKTERKEHENHPIGIILCKDMNKAYVDYVLGGYKTPMGIATYKTSKDMSEKLKRSLPDIDDLKQLLESQDIEKL